MDMERACGTLGTTQRHIFRCFKERKVVDLRGIDCESILLPSPRQYYRDLRRDETPVSLDGSLSFRS